MWKKGLAFVFVFAVCLTGYGEATCGDFVGTKGIHFVLNGKPFYTNGFNAYWLMYQATDPYSRISVTETMVAASKLGMNVVRTWAFSDGGNDRVLQISPGVYDERTFKGLDFVVAEAKKNGIYLIMSLVNNWDAYGGKPMYAKWANLNKADEFFTNNITKGYYKNHVKAVLTRNNTITGVAYKDDPAILGWELMNEPRCNSDPSGKSIQDWVVEMSAHVKSIDSKHLLQIGLEGFYGGSTPEREQEYPGYFNVGADFISNNNISDVDYSTIHVYPDQWLPGSSASVEAAFVERWMNDHLEDSKSILVKPLLFTEFGKSTRSSGYTTKVRDAYFSGIYKRFYESASSGGAGAGCLFWHVLALGMAGWDDGYGIVLERSNSTGAYIARQSHLIAKLNGPNAFYFKRCNGSTHPTITA